MADKSAQAKISLMILSLSRENSRKAWSIFNRIMLKVQFSVAGLHSFL